MKSRIYHSLHLDHTDNGSDKVIYILLPEQMEEGKLAAIEKIAETCGVNVILISGFDWDSCMTPWPAQDAFRKSKTYGGKAKEFLDEFINDDCFLIEHSMRIEKPERYLIGISLSGLFAVWATAQKDCFKGVASISGSFWYEGFQTWISGLENTACGKYYFSLGEKEKDSKNKVFAGVLEATETAVEKLRALGKEVTFELNKSGHFDNITEKISDAVKALVPPVVTEAEEDGTTTVQD